MSEGTSKIIWPEGKNFAFTIFDDTDLSTVENTAPVYELLYECGLRTTKSVWPIAGPLIPKVGGDTCEKKEYLDWIYDLKNKGFEIALHNVTYHTSTREETLRGFQLFENLFGDCPSSFANHTGCSEGIYWGDARITGVRRFLYNIMTRYERNEVFQGHVEGSKYFWGDVCKKKVTFVRNFTFRDLNTLKQCPEMPYHDPSKPYVNYWFGASEGAEVNAFNNCINPDNQDRLESEGGACIMYTHLACGFWKKGRLNSVFEQNIRRLSGMNGWFVPVSTLLNYILDKRGDRVLTMRERNSLEWRWLWSKMRTGRT